MTDSKVVINPIKGFSLAEVLITLAVIGIVSAMAIPSLIASINDNHYKTLFKQTYAILGQATTSLFQNEGIQALANYCADEQCLGKLYKKYLDQDILFLNETATLCKYAPCGAEMKGLNGISYPASWNISAGYQMVLKNNATISFNENYTPTCSPICASIKVDVNGRKTPNSLGKDIFNIQVISNGITPAASTCDSKIVDGNNLAGAGCAVNVLNNEDYK